MVDRSFVLLDHALCSRVLLHGVYLNVDTGGGNRTRAISYEREYDGSQQDRFCKAGVAFYIKMRRPIVRRAFKI